MSSQSSSDTLWLLAFLGSKFNSVSSIQNLLLILFTASLSYIAVSLFYWSHSGGPAWGRYLSRHSNTNKPIIPGPKGFPIIGSMALMTGLAHHKLTAATKRLSSTTTRLMAFSLGPNTRVIITSHPDVAKEILQSPAFADRPIKESAYGLMFNRAIGFAPYGRYWRTLRRIASTHMFSPKQIKFGEGRRREIVSRMVSEIINSSSCSINPKNFLVRSVLKRAALNNMMGSVLGWMGYEATVGMEEERELREMVDEGYDLLGGVNWADHLPWVADFDLQKVRFRCNRLVPKVNRFVGRIIDEHREKRKVGSGNIDSDFVDVLLSLEGDDQLSQSEMIAVLWEMIFRGTDTVAVLIEWILARLVLHPQIQSTVHDELDRVVGKSHDVTESNLPSLPYLTAVIKEALRLHPPGPLLSWARRSITDTTIDGHFIPIGTTAMVNMWAITRDPEIWPDPLEYKPERFLPVPGNEKSGLDMDFSVMGSDLRLAPFGSGKRSCPGKALGMTTVTYWVAALLHEFEWMAADDGVELSEMLKLSCEMATPLKVKVRARRSAAPSNYN